MSSTPSEFKTSFAQYDSTLIENGYEPVVILPGTKRPAAEGWQKGKITAKRLAADRKAFGPDTGTGLRTGRLVGVDIDISDDDHAKQVRTLAEEMLGQTPLVRVGKKGFLLCYRNEKPIKKRTLSAGNKAKIEILGIGQQFVALGIHPDTGKPYKWIIEDPALPGAPDDPCDVPLAALPAVTPDKLQAFLAAAGEKLTELGYPVKASTNLDGAPSKHVGQPISAKVLREALSYIDPDEEREEWRNVVAGIGAANVPDDDNREIRRKLALEWSRGELDPKGRYKDMPPSLYTGDADVLTVVETMPPKEGGIGVGTLIKKAQKNGYLGNPFDDGRTLIEKFAPAIEKIRNGEIKVNDAPSIVPNASQFPKPKTFGKLLSEPVTPVEEIVPGLVEKRIVNFLSGPGGSNKSRLAIQWGLCIQDGTPIFGRQVEQSTFVYVSYEDRENSVRRRADAIRRKLGISEDTQAIYLDLVDFARPIAIIDETEVQPTPFFDELNAYLRSIPGHKFIVVDSTYNYLRFTGAAKINESSVQGAISLLNRQCHDTNSTMLILWHPSQAGQERGNMTGWSVAWNNAPRSRLSLSRVKDHAETFKLKVEKRNDGPEGEEITLLWTNGALMPIVQMKPEEAQAQLMAIVVDVALRAVEMKQPFIKGRNLPKWAMDDIERACGRRPTTKQVKAALEQAVDEKKLRYVNGRGHNKAGYYASDDPYADPERRRGIAAGIYPPRPESGEVTPDQLQEAMAAAAETVGAPKVREVNSKYMERNGSVGALPNDQRKKLLKELQELKRTALQPANDDDGELTETA